MAFDNIMLDLECLDSNAKTAVIVSIGAVYMDLDSGELGDTFYKAVSLKGMQEQLDKGRTLSISTLQWWMQQSDDARSVFWAGAEDRLSTAQILGAFSRFCNGAAVWGNGVDYDNVALRGLYELYGQNTPWHYAKNRCYRTIKNVHGNRASLRREGTHHNALSDAITQAKHLIEVLKS